MKILSWKSKSIKASKKNCEKLSIKNSKIWREVKIKDWDKLTIPCIKCPKSNQGKIISVKSIFYLCIGFTNGLFLGNIIGSCGQIIRVIFYSWVVWVSRDGCVKFLVQRWKEDFWDFNTCVSQTYLIFGWVGGSGWGQYP